jgi:hypothetical protein
LDSQWLGNVEVTGFQKLVKCCRLVSLSFILPLLLCFLSAFVVPVAAPALPVAVAALLAPRVAAKSSRIPLTSLSPSHSSRASITRINGDWHELAINLESG